MPVIGGHSIKENEIKAGFAVTGLIDPRRIATNAAAQPGDRLVLTKPLGTGIIAFAARIGRAQTRERRRGRPVDGRAEPPGGRVDGAVRGACLHRCHRLRTAGPLEVDGRGQ